MDRCSEVSCSSFASLSAALDRLGHFLGMVLSEELNSVFLLQPESVFSEILSQTFKRSPIFTNFTAFIYFPFIFYL